jgi:hypothetical protein
MNRFEMLDEAKTTVRDRGESYGSVYENHKRVATMWSLVFGVKVKPTQVALAMACLKVARQIEAVNQGEMPLDEAGKPVGWDSWVDLAGYAATGAECAVKEAVNE